MELQFGTSIRGRRTVIYRNFEYTKCRENRNGTIVWRCCQFERSKCKATLKTSDDRVVSDRVPDHTHEGNSATSKARRAIGEMKNMVAQPTVTPSVAYGTVAASSDDAVLMALPKRNTIKRALQRYRRKQQHGDDGETLPAIPRDLNFVLPDLFGPIVLYDSGPGDDRLIIAGCAELLDGLARSSLWLADGTFKVTPSLFFQLYTIHFVFSPGVAPAAVYCLMTSKTEQAYNVVLNRVKQMIPAAAPSKVLVDFERAAMNAFRHNFEQCSVTGCYFHLCQSVLRKVNELGLKTVYETDEELRIKVRCLPALAFVPIDYVSEAFDMLSETMPHVENLDVLVTFFEHTYVRGRRLRGRGDNYSPALFPIDVWNQFDAGAEGIARTTNLVEGWHYGIQSLFQCSHPTMWMFFGGVQKEIQRQKALLLQGVAGSQDQPRKRYRLLNDRVQRAVSNFNRVEVLTYLRAIAHLSHT